MSEVYEASPLKSRRRATRDEMERRAEFLMDYAEKHGPVTVRQLYYRAEVKGVAGIDKTEDGYNKVQRQVLTLRRAKRLGYECIADSTRWMRKPTTFDSVEHALQETARLYRKALWRDAKTYVEVWLEKDALAGVIYPVTSLYDVPLMVARGYSSETFCFEAIAAREGDDRPYIVYYLGDFDRSGRDAAQSLEEKLGRFAHDAGVKITFVQLAIAEADLRQFDRAISQASVELFGRTTWLAIREPKRKTPADKAWPFDFAIELDAIEPDDLRTLVRVAIEAFLPPDQLKVLKTAEASERQLIAGLAGAFTSRWSPR